MTDQQPKTCGECRHYKPYNINYGECIYPIPAPVPMAVDCTELHRLVPAKDCPCHEPKEADHA